MQQVKKLQQELANFQKERKSSEKYREEIELQKDQIRTLNIEMEAKMRKYEQAKKDNEMLKKQITNSNE